MDDRAFMSYYTLNHLGGIRCMTLGTLGFIARDKNTTRTSLGAAAFLYVFCSSLSFIFFIIFWFFVFGSLTSPASGYSAPDSRRLLMGSTSVICHTFYSSSHRRAILVPAAVQVVYECKRILDVAIYRLKGRLFERHDDFRGHASSADGTDAADDQGRVSAATVEPTMFGHG